MKLGLSTLWTEEPATQSGDRTRLFAAHLSQAGAVERIASDRAASDRAASSGPASSGPATRKRRSSKPARASRPAPLL